MGLSQLDQDLTDTQKAVQTATREFSMAVWRPAAVQLDKLADPADVIAHGSVFWDVFRQTRAWNQSGEVGGGAWTRSATS